MKAVKLTAAMVLLVSLLSAGAAEGKVVLPEGTEIKVKFDPSVMVRSGKLQPGIILSIFLAEDIKIGGKTIIEAGAEGKAKVEEIVEAARVGKPGYIKVSFIDLEPKGEYKTISGERIKLAGTVEGKGKSRKVLSILFILGLFIKGSPGEIDNAQEYPASISETVVLDNK
jgi:hypothetical protein